MRCSPTCTLDPNICYARAHWGVLTGDSSSPLIPSLMVVGLVTGYPQAPRGMDPQAIPSSKYLPWNSSVFCFSSTFCHSQSNDAFPHDTPIQAGNQIDARPAVLPSGQWGKASPGRHVAWLTLCTP